MDLEYLERAAYMLLNNLILDFRNYFAADTTVYENAFADLVGKLPYPNLATLLHLTDKSAIAESFRIKIIYQKIKVSFENTFAETQACK